MEGGFLTGNFERKVGFVLSGVLFFGESERYVQEGSGNGQLSL
jgi:hypothetical protein